MKSINTVIMLLGLVSSPAFAAVSSFSCETEKPFEKGQTRNIFFKLSEVESKNVSIVSQTGHEDFRITPKSDALRALNTGDNNDINSNEDRIQIDADEIGMYHTTLVLWKKSKYHTGYVSTSGESNTKYYSPLTCKVE